MTRIGSRLLPLAVIFFIGPFIGGGAARAADGFDPLTHPVKASLIADVDAIEPGRPFRVGVLFKIEPHWHTYWAYPGDAGTPTTVKLETVPTDAAPGSGERGKAVRFHPIEWPLPQVIDLGGYRSLGYENAVLHIIPARATSVAQVGSEIVVKAHVTWQACKDDVCLDAELDLTLKLPVKAGGKPVNEALFAEWQAKVPLPLDAVAQNWVDSVQQGVTADGAPRKGFTVRWKGERPKSVTWLAVATAAVAVEDVKVTHEGDVTQVSFSTEVYDADAVDRGMVDGVLMFQTQGGRRQGVRVPVRVLPLPKVAK